MQVTHNKNSSVLKCIMYLSVILRKHVENVTLYTWTYRSYKNNYGYFVKNLHVSR